MSKAPMSTKSTALGDFETTDQTTTIDTATALVEYMVEETTFSRTKVAFFWCKEADSWSMDMTERMIRGYREWQSENAEAFIEHVQECASEDIGNAWWQAVDAVLND